MAFSLKSALVVIVLVPTIKAATSKTYRVTTVEGEPFVFKKDGRFQGYVPDVLDGIGKMLNVSFDISISPDRKYGSFTDEDMVNWTGMIGQLTQNRSDIAAADLTLTSTRARAVHFSQPYFDVGFRILIKKPPKWQELETLMVVLSPLKAEVWVVGLALFLAVSILLTLIGKFSPWEQLWIEGGMFDVTSLGMTFHNSLLFSFGSLMWQGFRVSPKSVSGRTLACFWWIFSMFFLVVYGANLVAFFLTKEPVSQSVPFATFDEMSQQSKVKFGCFKYGATWTYFKTSQDPVDARIYKALMEDQSVFVTSTVEAIRRVKEEGGTYAFIGENLRLEYEASRDCDLMVVGETRADNSYGFACRQQTTICRDLDVAILKLREAGVLARLKRKWWSGACYTPAEQEAVWNGVPYVDKARQAVGSLIDEKAVTLGRMGGPLILLLIGALLSVALLVVEILWVKRYGEPQRSPMSDDERRIKDNMDMST